MQQGPESHRGPAAATGCAFLWSVVVLTSCGGEKKAPAGPGARAAPAATEALLARGKELFAKHCATCHGAKGFGDGAAAYLLYPKPRDFSALQFRLVSTDNGVPTAADLFKTITNGMPGSAMPPWEHLPVADRWALVRRVEKLTHDGKVARLVADGVTAAEAKEIADEQCVVGTVISLPPATAATPEALARGKELYSASCQKCHDSDGRGRRKRDLKDDAGYPIFARDFTKGIFKGGAAATDLAMRFVAGMPGTPMPTFSDKFDREGDLWAIVHYVRSLIEPGARERVRQRRTEIVAKEVAKVAGDPEAAMWRDAPAVRLALMPLWWRDDRIEAVQVQAVHDRDHLGLRLLWEDATEDDHQVGQRAFGDAVAIQVSPDPDPPLFAMGVAGNPVNIWLWRAPWQADAAGFRDVEYAFPRAVADLYPSLTEPPFGRQSEVGEFPTGAHDALFLSGRGAGNPMSLARHPSPVEDLTAEGFGTLTSRPQAAQSVAGKGVWRDGRWTVVLVRRLVTKGAAAARFEAAKGSSVAFAVWDGSAGDRNGQKSVTIWHRLTLAAGGGGR